MRADFDRSAKDGDMDWEGGPEMRPLPIVDEVQLQVVETQRHSDDSDAPISSRSHFIHS
jgi:hypothetical protein